jgi:flagellar motor switch protein FliM
MTLTGVPATIGNEALKAAFMGAFDRLDRLPALQAALERAAASCMSHLRDTADPPPELTLGQLETGMASEMLAQHQDACVVAPLNIAQWNTRALLCADRASVFTIVEMMLGGDGVRGASSSERAFSKIELGIAQRFFERIAAVLEAAFASIAKSRFEVETATDRIDFDVIGRQHSPVVVARFGMRVWDQSGEILLVIPKDAIDAMRQVLGRAVADETKKADAGWSSRIKDEITRTSVTLSGVLDERLAPLHEIADLKVGQILQLSATAATRVRVECNGEPLLWCQLGKSNGAYTLRVEGPIDRDQEFMNDILAG